MMKRSILFSLLLIITISSSAQFLQGRWKGEFYSGTFSDYTSKTKIDIEFILNTDSTYTVYSYTYHNYKTDTCLVLYKKLTSDSIYLKEMPLTDDIPPIGFQIMHLKIISRKNKWELKGVWTDDLFLYRGDIYFRRSKKDIKTTLEFHKSMR